MKSPLRTLHFAVLHCKREINITGTYALCCVASDDDMRSFSTRVY